MLQLSVPATFVCLDEDLSLDGLVLRANVDAEDEGSWGPTKFLVFESIKRCFRVSTISLLSRIFGLCDCKKIAYSDFGGDKIEAADSGTSCICGTEWIEVELFDEVCV